MEPADASRRLGELVALTGAGDLAPLREAIAELDGDDAGELLRAAVLRVASLEAAVSLGTVEGERDAGGSLSDDVELAVEDPWRGDAESSAVAVLEQARLLRDAVVGQRDLPGLLNALDALSENEYIAIVFELALSSLALRGHRREERDR